MNTSQMTKNQRQQLIDQMLDEYQSNENEFAIIDVHGKFCIPINSRMGIVTGYNRYNEPHKNFKGLVLEVNDHGNVTVWQYFKNGNTREVASRV